MRVAVCFGILIVAAGAAWANPAPTTGEYYYDLIIDADNNPATGCGTQVQDKNIAPVVVPGIERIIRAKVSTDVAGLGYGTGAVCTAATPRVYGMERLDCNPQTGQFSHTTLPIVPPTGWNVGMNNGVNGADVIEAVFSYADLGPAGPTLKLVFRATGATPNSDVVLTTNGQSNGGPILLGLAVGAPAVSPVTLLMLAGWLVVAGTWIARRKAGRGLALGAVPLLLAVALTAWAATIITDGMVTDWVGITPVATDVTNDSSNDDSGEDIVAGFITRDAVKFYFRIDVMNLRPACPP